VHVTHTTPDGAPLFTPGTELAKEFEELKPKEGEKVSIISFPLMVYLRSCLWLYSVLSFSESEEACNLIRARR